MRGITARLCPLVIAALVAVPLFANRLTIEIRPDPFPEHALFCSVDLTAGRLSLVAVRGLGLPAPEPMRWHATDAEIAALSTALQAFLSGELPSVDPLVSRLPPAPYLAVTWMATLDDRPAGGLYIQSGSVLPPVLADALRAMGIERRCLPNATGGG